MATEAQIRAHDLLREQARVQILARMAARKSPFSLAPIAKKLTPVETPAKKMKSKTIPKKIRNLVWNLYIGKKIGESKCVCCDRSSIDKAEFQCGHILARAHGGSDTIDNLRPICGGCNAAMGVQNMEDYCRTFFGRGIINRIEESDDPINEINYDSMKVDELRDLCKKKGLKGYSKAKKRDLVELLSKE